MMLVTILKFVRQISQMELTLQISRSAAVCPQMLRLFLSSSKLVHKSATSFSKKMSQCGPKKLTDLSVEEQVKFFQSFDTVFSDMDGVLWHLEQTDLEEAPEAIAALRGLGKQCYFITNNSLLPLKVLLEHRLKKFNIVEEEIIRTSTALIWYLKKINFDQEIYITGSKAFKDEVKTAGFKVFSDEMTSVAETADGITGIIKSIRPNVRAVVIDSSMNVNFEMLQKCVAYITKNNALFLAGTAVPTVPFRGCQLIGTSYFIKAVQEVSGKEPIILSKPGRVLNDFMVEKLGPFDPKRILFIGDSPEMDMAFATKFGYQKLMPLTGSVTKEDLENWNFDEIWKPDYYVDSIKDIYTVVKNLGFNKLKL